MKRFGALTLVCSAALAEAPAFVQVRAMPAPEANQAVAVDDRFVYAVDSAVIAKYDRATGARVAVSTGKAQHLNSAFIWLGKVYCAHSNYPARPEKSEILVLDPKTMILGVHKSFGEYRGSLTWVVREGDYWWCTFAHYGQENAQTVLVKLDQQWREQGMWTYPGPVLRELGRYSISGGIWQEGRLLATGHDRRVIYRLSVPADGGVLELIDVLPAPFSGQGIAADPKTGGVVGIDRGKRQVVFAESRQ